MSDIIYRLSPQLNILNQQLLICSGKNTAKPAASIYDEFKSKARRTFHSEKLNDKRFLEWFLKKHTSFAKYLHDTGLIYLLYAALDGSSSAFSFLKYIFDQICFEKNLSSPDAMHDWMSSPTGAIATFLESAFIISFSLLANAYEPEASKWRKYIDTKCPVAVRQLFQKSASYWPYFRDGIKALKNAAKGIRSTLIVAENLGGFNLKEYVIPLGLTAGLLAAINRMWIRDMRSNRAKLIKANGKLLKKIENTLGRKNISEEICQTYRSESQARLDVKPQSATHLILFAGFIDGMYLFMGVMSAAKFTSQIYFALSMVSILFTAICIVTRLYEEYEGQIELEATHAAIELALAEKFLFKAYFDVAEMTLNVSALPEHSKERKDLEESLKGLIDTLDKSCKEYEKCIATVNSSQSLSTRSAILLGLKNGISAYQAMASAMWAYSSINTLLYGSVFISPQIVMATVIMGLIALVAFVGFALAYNKKHLNKQKDLEANIHSKLFEAIGDIKVNKNPTLKLKNEEDKINVQFIAARKGCKSTSKLGFDCIFEIFRSGWAGASKAQKIMDLFFNSYLEADDNGHYREAPFMLKYTLLVAVISMLGFSLRTDAKTFGKSRGVGGKEDKIASEFEEETNSPAPPPANDPTSGNQRSSSIARPFTPPPPPPPSSVSSPSSRSALLPDSARVFSPSETQTSYRGLLDSCDEQTDEEENSREAFPFSSRGGETGPDNSPRQAKSYPQPLFPVRKVSPQIVPSKPPSSPIPSLPNSELPGSSHVEEPLADPALPLSAPPPFTPPPLKGSKSLPDFALNAAAVGTFFNPSSQRRSPMRRSNSSPAPQNLDALVNTFYSVELS